MTDIFFPVVERDCVWIDKTGGKNSTGKKAIVACLEDKSPQLIGLVGEDYKLLHNRDVYVAIAQVIAGNNTKVKMYCDRNLSRTFFDVTFNDIYVTLNDHRINFRAIFWNGYAGSSLGLYAGAINFFCMNGMITGVYETKWKRHTKSLDTKVIKDWLHVGISTYQKQTKNWFEYGMREITFNTALNLFERFDEKRTDDMSELYRTKYTPTYGPTLWSALNCMTDVATHFDKYKKRKVTSSTEHSSAFSRLIQAEKVVGDYYTSLAA